MPKEALFLIPSDGIRGFTDFSRFYGAASLQLQLKPAINACKNLGMKPECFSLQHAHPEDLELVKNPSICIVGKIKTTGEDNVRAQAMAQLALLARLKRKKVPIAIIYSDHVEEWYPSTRELYKDFLHLSDHIIFPCTAIQKKCLKWVPAIKSFSIIEDPWQVKQRPFNTKTGNEINALWFGHHTNLPFMLNLLNDLKKYSLATKTHINLNLLTSQHGLNKYRKFINKFSNLDTFKINCIIWNEHDQPFQLECELEKATFSLIPSDPKNPHKSSASHNRLVDSVRAGCITIASPLESYIELSKVALIGPNLIELLHYANQQKQRLAEKYNSNRTKYLKRFSPEFNKYCWEKCISRIVNQKPGEP